MIFPDWQSPHSARQAALPPFREWAVDWAAGALHLKDGEPYTVTGDEALRTWIRLALDPRSRRFCASAHSHSYGNELQELLGHCRDEGIRNSQLRRAITETLLTCPYIRTVGVFSFSAQGSRVSVSFTVGTVYYSIDMEVDLT